MKITTLRAGDAIFDRQQKKSTQNTQNPAFLLLEKRAQSQILAKRNKQQCTRKHIYHRYPHEAAPLAATYNICQTMQQIANTKNTWVGFRSLHGVSRQVMPCAGSPTDSYHRKHHRRTNAICIYIKKQECEGKQLPALRPSLPRPSGHFPFGSYPSCFNRKKRLYL